MKSNDTLVAQNTITDRHTDRQAVSQYLLGDVALVLGAEVVSPLGQHVELDLLLLGVGAQKLHRLGVGDLRKVALHHVQQAVVQALFASGVLVL